MKKQILRTFAALLAIMLLAGAMSLGVFASGIEARDANGRETITTAGTYSLFNSGRTGYGTNSGTSGYDGSYNPAETTYTNEGYDIYVEANGDPYSRSSSAQLGLSFYVANAITEKVQLSVYAYDVDESDGELDRIYLVDETTGDEQLIGALSGMNEEWNNSTFDLAPSMFQSGHTYHYQVRGEVWGWVVYIRTVAMSVMATDAEVPDDDNVEQPVITDVSAFVSISSEGRVDATLRVYSSEYRTFDVEWKVMHAETGNQSASYFGVVDASPNGETNTFSFYLENGASVGTYRIDAYIKEYGTNNVVQAATTVAGYISLAVAYNANGGTQNLPLDYTAYYEGDEVVVLFDYVPSRPGYTFLGWATSEYATEPEFVSGENVRLSMSDTDVTLYAIWGIGSSNSTPETLETVTETETEVETFLETEYEDWYDDDDDYNDDYNDTPNNNYYGEWYPSNAYSYSDAIYDVLFGCSGSISIAAALPLVGVAGVLMLRKRRK